MSNANQDSMKKKKGFFGKIIDKLDEKMAERANKPSCCASSNEKDKGSSCC